ncbi:MAG: GDSL-type esterase/lipase family protein [Nocardioides sp.]
MARLARRIRFLRAFLLVFMAGLVGVIVGLVVLGSTQEDEVAPPTSFAIWPVGDSITFGSSSDGGSIAGGYRGTLEASLVAAGLNPRFVGTSAANPPTLRATAGSFGHDGWPGQRIDHFETALLADSPLSGGHWLNGLAASPGIEARPPLRPDVVVVHLGTNDIVESRDPESRYPGGYTATDDKERSRFVRHLKSRLVDFLGAILRVRPEAAFVLCTIAPLGPQAPTSTDFNALIRDDVVPKLRRVGTVVELADVEEALGSLPGSVGDDGVHPTEAGYRVMGETIAAAVGRLALAVSPD